MSNTLTKKGIESLTASVKKDCEQYSNCFNPNGCDKERYRYENGHCYNNSKCTHDYCGKYKWTLDRAEQYANFLGCTKEEVLEAWENQRSYWYMNFYQDGNQPELKGEGVKVVKIEAWLQDLSEKFGKDPKGWKFICPACKSIQCGQDFIDAGIEDFNGKVYSNCIGRYVKGKGCDWSLGGLLKMHNKVVVKDMQIFPVFETANA
jgi:hypothetical protein